MSALQSSQEIAIGIDIGGTNTKFGIVNRAGVVLAKGRIKTKDYPSISGFINALYDAISSILQTNPDLVPVGIGVGAPNANHYKGTIEYAPNLNWEDVIPFTKLIEAKFQQPCSITNDANAAALGELKYGAAQGMSDFIMITLGTGVGSGIISNGELVYGHDSFAGELGHCIVKPGGRMHWSTKSLGSLEAYASATGISITAKKHRAEFPESMLNNFPEDQINAQTVYQCAEEGDKIAIEVFRYTGQILGEALANFIMFSSPEAIFLFGGVIKAGDYIIQPTRHHMEKNLLPIFRNKVKIITSQLAEADAAILGASAMVWSQEFNYKI